MTWEPPSLAKVALTGIWVLGASFSVGWLAASTVYRAVVRRKA